MEVVILEKGSDSTGMTKALTEFATSMAAVLTTPQEACVGPLKKDRESFQML